MSKKSYKDLQAELDAILAELQSDDIDLDAAIELHKQGKKLIESMEKILDQAEVKIKKLK